MESSRKSPQTAAQCIGLSEGKLGELLLVVLGCLQGSVTVLDRAPPSWADPRFPSKCPKLSSAAAAASPCHSDHTTPTLHTREVTALCHAGTW